MKVVTNGLQGTSFWHFDVFCVLCCLPQKLCFCRELGYDKPEDHIRECKLIESRKQKHIMAKEEHRLRQVNERNERLMAIVKGEAEAEKEQIGDDKDEDDNQVRTVVNNEEESEKEEEDEDEELAMARAIESEQVASALSDGENSGLDDDNEDKKESIMSKQDSGGQRNKDTKFDNASVIAEVGGVEIEEISDTDTVKKDFASTMSDSENSGLDVDHENKKESVMNQQDSEEQSNNDTKFDNVSVKAEAVGTEIKETSDTETAKSDKRPKNAAWKAMLEKEKQLLKKQKSLRKGQIDDEAEEEEEEEGVTGLEDFGFTVKSNNKEDEDDDNEADDEDLENVVDDVSDGEGDEEAGDNARKELQAREEKMRHKEMLRRIREGYDGRRGGVAGGASKRGNLRFDQLVAADNKDDAKRLGLLNDDELDSEDEEANVAGEVEDEEVLIDKMLKDRYLNRPELPEENFSDSDEESDDDDEGNGKSTHFDPKGRYQLNFVVANQLLA